MSDPAPARLLSRRDAAAHWRRLRGSGSSSPWLLLVVVGVAAVADHFFELDNLVNVSRQSAIVGILGIGMTFVILTAGIDLSVGSIVGFSAIAFAAAMAAGVPWPLAILLRARGRGAGRRAQRSRHHQGSAAAVHHDPRHARHRPRRDDDVRRGQADLARRQGRLVRLARHRRPARAAGAGVDPARRRRRRRRSRCATRSSAVTSTPSATTSRRRGCPGINTNRVIFSVYVISGFCAAMSALIIVSRLTAGEPSQGTGFELDAIAIVVIGGTSLFGGEGGIGGTLDRCGDRRRDGQPAQPARGLALLPADRQGPDHSRCRAARARRRPAADERGDRCSQPASDEQTTSGTPGVPAHHKEERNVSRTETQAASRCSLALPQRLALAAVRAGRSQRRTSGDGGEQSTGEDAVIGFSQANNGDVWRINQTNNVETSASELMPDAEILVTDGQGDGGQAVRRRRRPDRPRSRRAAADAADGGRADAGRRAGAGRRHPGHHPGPRGRRPR